MAGASKFFQIFQRANFQKDLQLAPHSARSSMTIARILVSPASLRTGDGGVIVS
jgi:hypothetical protein